MDIDTIKSILTGLIRYVLIAIFGGLVQAGYITENNILLASGLIAGALVVVGSMVWRKIKTKYQLEAMAKLPAATTVNAVKEQIESAKQSAQETLAKAAPITKLLP